MSSPSPAAHHRLRDGRKVACTPYRGPLPCWDRHAVHRCRRRRYPVTPPAVAPATTDAPPATQRLPGTSVPITTTAATTTTARNAIPKMVFHHRPGRKDSNSISRIHAGSVGSIPDAAAQHGRCHHGEGREIPGVRRARHCCASCRSFLDDAPGSLEFGSSDAVDRPRAASFDLLLRGFDQAGICELAEDLACALP
jgi:hypothetical protein